MLSERICPLTQRQIEVLAAVAREGSYKAAAVSLGCSYFNVRTLASHCITRLGGRSITTAAVYAVERGWIRNVTIDRETRWMAYDGGLEGVG